ncbi:MAG TPA: bifunctional acetate--CoA ligase family protein/GNAT family N-acetyltransferase [Planctomycetota bacterium]|nr:bifunctional acetate--CoA ligase family protein/GNAT family N-acetyltransferase [Planctomycetota bacterium]
MFDQLPTEGCRHVAPETAQPLDCIFKPRSVALVGATDRVGSVGATLMRNLLLTPFGGTIYPVNPKRAEVMGVRAYRCISQLPEVPELAVIVTPAPTVPDLIERCVNLGVKGAIVISAGFKENGAGGQALETRIKEIARGKIRIIGPNCLGVMNPVSGLNATFAASMAKPGSVGFISQSGALCTAILDWSFKENVGFSAFVSTGSMLDVNWGDLIYHLGDDPNTKSIVIYMESIGDARSFLSAAREIALTKPIIVIKAGRTAVAAKAAASHTGALAGSDDVLDAAFRRCGVLRVDTIAELFHMAEVLAKQPRPSGPRLTIVTNAGGPGVLATDALISKGGKLAELSEDTTSKLNALLPPHWSHGNPIDVLGDADAKRYADAFEAAAADPNSDGMLVILTPQAMTEPTETAEKICKAVKNSGKPILASWMGGESVDKANAIFNAAGIPAFSYPDSAARLFQFMWQYSANLARLYETPEETAGIDGLREDAWSAEQFLHGIRASGRTLLTEAESKELLSIYDIPTVPTYVANGAEEAARIAHDVGFPVVLKLNSYTITHKTDVGGVQLNLANAEQVREAFARIENSVREKTGAHHFQGVTVQPMIARDGYEIILGSSLDEQFGPVIMVGMGGQLVEVFKDRALALPPLTTTLARQMLERTKIFTALKGVRGRAPADLGALDRLIVRFSQLVVEQPCIKEIDINPLLASPERILALDARVVLHDASIKDEDLPRAAIRPYPSKYVTGWRMKDGRAVTLRPIRPEDEPLMVKFHESLSERSVRLRYLYAKPLEERIDHQRLMRNCFVDYEREIALVAERNENGERVIIAVGRLIKSNRAGEAHLYLVVTDHEQGLGLGTEVAKRMVQVARNEKVKVLYAESLRDAKSAIQLLESVGFVLDKSGKGEAVFGRMLLN